MPIGMGYPPTMPDPERVPIQRYFASKKHKEAHGPTPLNAKGKHMCLLFHIRGTCKHDCPRLQDHYRHTPEESLHLAAYLALANPAPVPTPPAV
jgi:hypothetical protein